MRPLFGVSGDDARADRKADKRSSREDNGEEQNENDVSQGAGYGLCGPVGPDGCGSRRGSGGKLVMDQAQEGAPDKVREGLPRTP